MKQKDFCNRCGKLFVRLKLKKAPHSKRILCPVCYNKESNDRFLSPLANENLICIDIQQNEKKLVRPSQFEKFKPLLTKDEIEVLNNKYKFDKFISGKNKCIEISTLKNAIKATKKKKLDDDSEKLCEKATSKQQNDFFLKGLLQK